MEPECPGVAAAGLGDEGGVHEPHRAERIVAEPLHDGCGGGDEGCGVEVVLQAEVSVGEGACGLALAADQGPAVKRTPDVTRFIRSAERAAEPFLNAAPLFVVVVIPDFASGDGFADAAGQGVVAVGGGGGGAVCAGDEAVPCVPGEGAGGAPCPGFGHGFHVAGAIEGGRGDSGDGGDFVGFVVGAALGQGRAGGVIAQPVARFVKRPDFRLLEVGNPGVVGGSASQVPTLMLIVLLQAVIPIKVILLEPFRRKGGTGHGVGQDVALPGHAAHPVAPVGGVHEFRAAGLPDRFHQPAKAVESGIHVPGIPAGGSVMLLIFTSGLIEVTVGPLHFIAHGAAVGAGFDF